MLVLENIDPYNNKSKTEQQIKQDAVTNTWRGMLCSIPGATMQEMIKYANGNTVAKELGGYTEGLGAGMEQFFGVLDNLLLAGWNAEESVEQINKRGIDICVQ